MTSNDREEGAHRTVTYIPGASTIKRVGPTHVIDPNPTSASATSNDREEHPPLPRRRPAPTSHDRISNIGNLTNEPAAYHVIWEYRVKPGAEAEFETGYEPEGEWVRLFERADGYLGSDLLHDTGLPDRYVTIDRWRSLDSLEAFHAAHETEYRALDELCEGLTTSERQIGAFATLNATGAPTPPS